MFLTEKMIKEFEFLKNNPDKKKPGDIYDECVLIKQKLLFDAQLKLNILLAEKYRFY